MDGGAFWSHFRFKSRILERISALSHRVKEKFWLSSRPLVLGGIYLFLSVVLGLAAFRWTQDQVLSQWRQTHVPKITFVRTVLTSLGGKEVTQLDSKQRVLRSLPVSTDMTGRFWFTSDLDWVVVFYEEDAGSELKTFCRFCRPKPQNWTPTSIGWEGFEQVVKELEERLKTERRLVGNPRSNQVRERDPREIVY